MHLQSQRCDLKARYFELIIRKHTTPTQTTRRINSKYMFYLRRLIGV